MSNITSELIKKLLKRSYGANQGHREAYAYFEEFRGGTGYGDWNMQSIDFWVMGLWGSQGYEKTAYEIKVSRSDFLSEIKNPKKRRMALAYSNRFYFICPAGLIKPEEVPIECGLKEVYVPTTRVPLPEDSLDKYSIKKVVEAPFRDPIPPNWAFMANLCRRVFREEVQA